ncbi:14173_t:CDS:2, partial [Cetraspora pellucida]
RHSHGTINSIHPNGQEHIEDLQGSHIIMGDGSIGREVKRSRSCESLGH